MNRNHAARFTLACVAMMAAFAIGTLNAAYN